MLYGICALWRIVLWRFASTTRRTSHRRWRMFRREPSRLQDDEDKDIDYQHTTNTTLWDIHFPLHILEQATPTDFIFFTFYICPLCLSQYFVLFHRPYWLQYPFFAIQTFDSFAWSFCTKRGFNTATILYWLWIIKVLIFWYFEEWAAAVRKWLELFGFG